MVSFKIIAGTYDLFVATYLFNSDTSALTLQSKSPTGQGPSWLSLNPTNCSLLYAVNEISTGGAVQSFTVDADGGLSTPIDTAQSEGGNPAFVTALSTGEVAVVNYGSGNAKIMPTTSQGSKFNSSTPPITFPTQDGTSSHPHMVLEYKNEVLIPDLGQDTIWRLKKNTLGTYSIQGSIPQPKGSGPRHIAIFNDRLFTLHELSSTLSVQTMPALPNGPSITFATASIVPSDSPANAKWAAAEILIPQPSKKFPIPYIYVSNRNKGTPTSTGDSIAIFEHVSRGEPNEGLVLVKQVFTGLQQIRGMEFGGAEQEFLIAGGSVGATGVVMLRRTEGGRNLEIVARNTDVPILTSFVWI